MERVTVKDVIFLLEHRMVRLYSDTLDCTMYVFVHIVLTGYCAALPPIECFMEVSRNVRRQHFFEVSRFSVYRCIGCSIHKSFRIS